MNGLATDFYSVNYFQNEKGSFFDEQTISRRADDCFSYVIHNGVLVKSSDLSFINQMLDDIVFPEGWIDDGVSLPSEDCKKKTQDTAVNFVTKFNLLPLSMHASIEEGILLVFRRQEQLKSLKIEIYNDGDIAGIINDNKRVVVAIDVLENRDYETLVDEFKKG